MWKNKDSDQQLCYSNETWQYLAHIQDGEDVSFVVGQVSWFGLGVGPLGHALSPCRPAHLRRQRAAEVNLHQFLKMEKKKKKKKLRIGQSIKHNS